MKLLKIAATVICLLLLSLVSIICTMVESTSVQSDMPPAPEQVERLRAHVETLCEQPRHGATIEYARNYIEARLRTAGWEVRRQQFITSDGESRCNICALRRGRSGKRFIIGAHYDSCDTGEGPNPGADDNASAVAVLLELAEQLPTGTPLHDIELVAWDCEEPPHFDTEDMGSAHHAAHADANNVLGLICLEMLGYYSNEPDSQPSLFPGHSLLLPTVGNFVAVVGNLQARPLAKEIFSALQKELPAVRINIPWAEETALFFSDHRNYLPLGIPSVMVTDTAMLRNSHYHEPTDTPDTLNYEQMGRVTRALSRIITSLVRPMEASTEQIRISLPVVLAI
ncbi:MAG: M28 family peptidase [Akkermansia sp.]|nr:M28 family peptidase [Akkermansia sp.]